MNRSSYISYVIIFALSFVFYGNPAFANKSSIRIEAPETVAMGQEITIKLYVSHDGNNFIHHTDWVYLKINNQEIKRWTFGMFDTPESENFTLEIKYTATGPITITAEADCNMHGSMGISEKTITIQ
jgi:desulfoferrodoxin (superoxide reductase-like protein)